MIFPFKPSWLQIVHIFVDNFLYDYFQAKLKLLNLLMKITNYLHNLFINNKRLKWFSTFTTYELSIAGNGVRLYYDNDEWMARSLNILISLSNDPLRTNYCLFCTVMGSLISSYMYCYFLLNDSFTTAELVIKRCL